MSTHTAGMVPEFSLGDRLRKAREVAGLEQAELADRMGVSRGTISNAEGGKHAVREITLRAWAMVTGVDAGWLETGRPSGDLGPDGGAFTVSQPESGRLLRLSSAA